MDQEQLPAPVSANTARLRGRLGADPVPRTLPSGAEIVTFRVIMSREATVMTRGSRQKSDWVDCTAWSSAARRRVTSWAMGDIVEVEGALRRRHYRDGGGTGSSRLEVEMLAGRRAEKARKVAAATDEAVPG
jgi:single-strand DNA-binding protein